MQFLKICYINTPPNLRAGKTVGAEWIAHIQSAYDLRESADLPSQWFYISNSIIPSSRGLMFGWGGIDSFCVFPLEMALYIWRIVCFRNCTKVSRETGLSSQSSYSSQLALAVHVFTELTCRALVFGLLSCRLHQEDFTVRTGRKHESDYRW